MLDVKKLLSKILNSPFIVEEGTSGIWTYRKWSDGIAECWGAKTESKSLTAWGSWYYARIDGPNYPTGLFTTLLSVTGSLGWPGGDLVSGLTSRPPQYNVTAPNVIGVRPSNLSGTHNATAFWHAVGRWK